MPQKSKRRRQIEGLAEAKRQKKKAEHLESIEQPPELLLEPSLDAGNISDVDSSEESEVEVTDCEDDCQFDNSAFDKLLSARATCTTFGQDTNFKYQRTCQPSKRTTIRHRAKQQELVKAAKGCRTLTSMLASQSSITDSLPAKDNTNEETRTSDLADAIKTLERKLASKKASPDGQNRTRHQAVLHFLKVQQSSKSKESREDMALTVARCYGRGIYFARKLISWERTWIASQTIEEGKQGCFQKTSSWFNDEGVMLAVRKWLAGASEGRRIIRISMGYW